MTQWTDPWENGHLERGFELLRTFGLVVPGWGPALQSGGLSRGHYWLLNLGLALPNWSSENQKEFSSANCKIRPYVPNPLRCFKCQRFGHSQTACRGQLTCSRCAIVGHPSTDCTLEPKFVYCSQFHPSDSKLCSKWKTEKEIQVTKLSTTTTTTQTDENITKIVCSSLKFLQPLISVPKQTISSSVLAVNKFSTSTQAELVPSPSSVTVASPSKSQPLNSVIDTAPTTSNSLSISAASSSSTACSVLETTTTTSNTIPTISQETTQTSKPRRKKRPPKNQSNTIKPKIEIKTAPHRLRKPAPTEYSTDEEDMIVYDVWKMNLS
ncbi:RNA-directed DNA polymerase from mobile element jockey [Trichonephila clavipes]|nr:RNA-directed DNA polymerase from mobile element jockey [Trichonephila clavipes]